MPFPQQIVTNFETCLIISESLSLRTCVKTEEKITNLNISRVPDQTGVSQAWYIAEIHHSGREPSIYVFLTTFLIRLYMKYPKFCASNWVIIKAFLFNTLMTKSHPWLRTTWVNCTPWSHKFHLNIQGFRPEWYISTMYLCRDIPLWSETLKLYPNIYWNCPTTETLQIQKHHPTPSPKPVLQRNTFNQN